MEKTTFHIPQRNIIRFEHIDELSNTHQVTFNSNFDSGNFAEVISTTPNTVITHLKAKAHKNQFIINTAVDCAGTPFAGCAKSWFYFSVKGFPSKTNVTFIIRRLTILWTMVNKLSN